MNEPLISQFTADDYGLLNAFFSDVATHGGWFDKRLALRFALVLADEKPAFEFTTLATELESRDRGEEFHISLELVSLIEDLGLPYKPRDGEFSGRPIVFHECGSTVGFTLPSRTDPDTDQFHWEWGQHYGYPDSAIEGFISDNCLRYFSYESDLATLKSIAANLGVDDDILHTLPLTAFVPPETPSGVLEAVTLSHQYETALRSIAAAYDVPHVEVILDEVMETNAEIFEQSRTVENV